MQVKEKKLCVWEQWGRSEMDFALSEVAVRYGQIIARLVQQRRMITGFIVSRRHNQPYLMSLIQHTHYHLIYGVRWLSLPHSGFIMATILLEFSLLYAFFLVSISCVDCISFLSPALCFFKLCFVCCLLSSTHITVHMYIHLCWTQGHAN